MDQDNKTRNIAALRVSNPWLVPYMGRKLDNNKDDISQYFDCDFFPDENAGLNDIVFFVRFSTEDGILTDFEYEKYKDLSGGHGRPHPEDKELNTADISKLVAVLTEYTVPRSDSVLETLIAKAKTKSFPGWRIEKDNKRQVVFASTKDGSKEAISKTKILRALEWSYSYIEILDDPDFWKANEKYLDYTHNDILRSFFSLIDTSIYPNYGSLLAGKKYRDQLTWKHISRRRALIAARDDDLDTLKELIRFAPGRLSVEEMKEGILPALTYATMNGNIEMVRLLVANNAYREENFMYEGEQRVAATFAIEKGFEEILSILLENPSTLVSFPRENHFFYYGEKSMLTTAIKTNDVSLIEKVARISTCDIDISDITDIATLVALSYCQKLHFSEDQLRSVYAAGYYDAARRISAGTTPLYYESIMDVLLKDAFEKGLEETKLVIERIYAPVSNYIVSQFIENWPFGKYTIQENEEAIKYLISLRDPQPLTAGEDSNTITYNTMSMKIIGATGRYCSTDMLKHIIEYYWPSLHVRSYPDTILNIINLYKSQEKDAILNSLPMLRQ